MSHDDLQEPLQPFPAVLNHVVAEAVGEHFPGKGWDGNARRLALEDVPEVLEVAVAAPHDAVAQLEGWDVGAGMDLVGGVHAAGGGAVGLWILDLEGGLVRGRRRVRTAKSLGWAGRCIGW